MKQTAKELFPKCREPLKCPHCEHVKGHCTKDKDHTGDCDPVPAHLCEANVCPNCKKQFPCRANCGHGGLHDPPVIPVHDCGAPLLCPRCKAHLGICALPCGHPPPCPVPACTEKCRKAIICDRCNKSFGICKKNCGHPPPCDLPPAPHRCGKPLICGVCKKQVDVCLQNCGPHVCDPVLPHNCNP